MLLDTNILVYSLNIDSFKYEIARKFIRENSRNLEIAHQNILEGIRVLTRQKFSNPIKLKEALNAITSLSSSLNIISPKQSTYYLALEMIEKHKLAGNRIFDAYLAATALSNGVDTIVTDNVRDFKKFKELKITNPFDKE